MMPYQTLQGDLTITAMERTDPQFEWVHRETGEHSTKAPVGWDDKQAQVERERELGGERAEAILKQFPWERVRLWTIAHDTFCLCLPLVVDMAPEGAPTPAAAALLTYWNGRTGNVEDDWVLFTQLLGADALTALWQAYTDTRDKKLAAPQGIEGSDPNP